MYSIKFIFSSSNTGDLSENKLDFYEYCFNGYKEDLSALWDQVNICLVDGSHTRSVSKVMEVDTYVNPYVVLTVTKDL